MAINLVIYRYCTVFSILLFISTSSATVSARQLDDVTLPDTITLNGSNVPLQLNGMGYRSKFVFNIYVAALYTEKKVATRDAVQALKGPKRVVMHMVYDEVSRKKMTSAWHEGFEDNNDDKQLQNLQSRLQTFVSYFPDLKKGDVVLLDYLPALGTRVTIQGVEKGLIEGDDFYAALIDVWLGEEPADDDLKDAMLGEVEED